MQFLLLVYIDPALLDAVPPAEFDAHMRHCFEHTDVLKAQGHLLDARQLEPTETARSIRSRAGKTTVLDGPFAETKEMLAGFNLIEASSMDEAMRIAHAFPWSRYGTIEVRPVRDLDAVRRRVGA